MRIFYTVILIESPHFIWLSTYKYFDGFTGRKKTWTMVYKGIFKNQTSWVRSIITAVITRVRLTFICEFRTTYPKCRGSSERVFRTTYPNSFFKKRFRGSSERVLRTTYPIYLNEVIYRIFIFSKCRGSSKDVMRKTYPRLLN